MARRRTRATGRCAPRMGGPSGGGVSSRSSGCRARSCGSSPFRSLSRCAPASPAALTAVDGLGVLLFAVGFGFEVVGDYQLERFRGEPSNRGKVLDRGLWRYTRHPNYFGDATLWWGLYAIAAATPSGWLTVLSPALMTFLLMRVSGRDAARGRPESLEAGLSRVHHPHAGVLPLVSARSAVIDCGAPPTECQFRGTLRRQRGRSGRRSADRRAAPLNRSTSNRRPQARARHRPCARSMCPQWCR